MQVNFKSLDKYNSPFYEFERQSNSNCGVSNSKPSRDEVIIAKTKKAVSECKYVVIGLGILYFAMKKNLKLNKIKNQERKIAELAKMKIPSKRLINSNPVV